MTPDSFDTFRRIESEISEVRESLARVETKLTTLCQSTSERRVEQRAEHERCQAHIHSRLDEHEEAINTLSVKWKVISGFSGAVIAALTILNILLSVGVRL